MNDPYHPLGDARLYRGVFVERPNRFLMRCAVPRYGTVEAFVANPGRMDELIFSASQIGFADFVVLDTPEWQGDAGSLYYGWENFTQPYGVPNMNDSGVPGSMLFNFAEGAFITSTGNIYNQGGGLDIHVYGYSAIEQAVLNISSQGSEFDYAGVSLWVGDGTDGMMFFANEWSMNYYQPVEGMGAIANTSYSWDLSSYEGMITEWAFFFQGTEAHNVLDAVTVDIYTGAVPSAGGLFAFGLLGLRTRRR